MENDRCLPNQEKQLLYLFGSRATNEHKPGSDYDVFIDMAANIATVEDPYEQEADHICHGLEEYTVEQGGELDLFLLFGDELIASMNYERKIILGKHGFTALQEDAIPITYKWLKEQLGKE